MSSSCVKIIKSYDEFRIFKDKSKRGIIFYSASWCTACSTIKPLYERIAARYSKHVRFAYCDIDFPGTALDFSAIPVFVTYYKGKEINSLVGSDKNGMKDLIREIITHKD